MRIPCLPFMLLCGLSMAACQKDNEPSGPAPGSGTPVDPVDTLGEYLRFDLDGDSVRLPGYTASSSSASGFCVHVAQAYDENTEQIAQWWLSLACGYPLPLTAIYDQDPDPNYGFSVITYTDPQDLTQFQYFDLAGGEGSTIFTRLDTVVGGRVEGTFSYQNVTLFDQNDSILSTGHTIMEGRFSIRVDT